MVAVADPRRPERPALWTRNASPSTELDDALDPSKLPVGEELVVTRRARPTAGYE
jgi:hypothetical protein